MLRVSFGGWPADAIDFYDGLEEDNSKAYWQAHKATYDRSVRGPMEELLAELAGQFGPGRIFRPNRDVRFSADKSPYKTAIGATMDNGGYLQLSAAGLAAGRGMYMMAADQLLARSGRAAPQSAQRSAPCRLPVLVHRWLVISGHRECTWLVSLV